MTMRRQKEEQEGARRTRRRRVTKNEMTALLLIHRALHPPALQPLHHPHHRATAAAQSVRSSVSCWAREHRVLSLTLINPKCKRLNGFCHSCVSPTKNYRNWRIKVREAVCAASDRPDDAFKWISRTWEHQSLVKNFRISAHFSRLMPSCSPH